MQLNGSEILLECLLEQGADTVFGYPGGAVLNIYDALYKYSDRITHIITAHEQAASHAADGFARTTGKTGVVIATSGPGATNLVTGLATANMDSIPVVAITGNVGTSSLGLDSFQEVDICGITMPITKHNFIVKDVNDLADTVRDAFRIANEGRKGPVLIDIPKDVTAAVTEYVRKTPVEIVNHNPDDINEQIDRAAELIKASERPFIYAGGGVVSCDAEGALGELVNRIDAPIALSLMGQSAFYNKDERYVGMLGMHGTKTASRALRDCDLMIVLGSRFSDRVALNTKTFGKHTKIIHVEIDPAEIGKNVVPDCYVNGDLKYVLTRLNELIPQTRHPEWIAQIAEWKKKYPLTMQPIHDPDEVLPNEVIETLNRLTDAKAIITTEVGQHQMWAAQFYDFTEPRTFASSGGLGTMGYGLGASIGAKVGNPDKTVVNIAGDGSFFMNCNELSTLAKHQLPVIELVFTNNVLGMVRQWQRLFYDKRFSQTTLDRGTDYMKLAEAFGIEGVRITKKDEIEAGLKKALECGRPCLVECVIDKDVNVLPMVPAGGDVLKPIMTMALD
ncbi:acetolactate synthase, large subunit [Ruminococcus sp. YE71]|uniref:biosynthetic-type acetolactate synthase large subunit n=1 Tax=unclassified Ruminococcus TaxID=2608920 RepID=UPI00087F7C3F|nr:MULTISPECIES: biosynthetic-type acetolactate synthase large subunit [unclassified Ruminococcus]SDA19780.1 acetolactate synthase, large subunit [Ruminococcus sp. YE78]SFW31345.1 acetolactate synthase, large subunit [Ruminococcus sp. YE71]